MVFSAEFSEYIRFPGGFFFYGGWKTLAMNSTEAE